MRALSEPQLRAKVNAAMKGVSTLGLALAISIALSACGLPAPTTSGGKNAPSASSTTTDTTIAATQTLPNTLPAPSADQPRFVGLWAATAEGCANPAWRFHADQVSTAGEVSCSFRSVRQTQTGYDIDALCTAEAPPRDYKIQIGFAESARAMMLTGGPWSASGLVYCGPL